MIKCKVCGNLYAEGEEICPFCGSLIQQTSTIHELGNMDANTSTNRDSAYARDSFSQNVNGVNYSITQQGDSKKKGILFAVLALVLGLLAILLICCPLVGIIFSIAGVVFAIIALAKKNKKVISIIALIINGGALLCCLLVFGINMVFKSIAAVTIPGLFYECFDTAFAEDWDIGEITIVIPSTSKSNEPVAYYFDGIDSGYAVVHGETLYFTYTKADFVDYEDDESDEEDITYAVIATMRSGRSMKDMMIYELTYEHGEVERLPLVIDGGDEYKAGDQIYYCPITDDYDAKLIPVSLP